MSQMSCFIGKPPNTACSGLPGMRPDPVESGVLSDEREDSNPLFYGSR